MKQIFRHLILFLLAALVLPVFAVPVNAQSFAAPGIKIVLNGKRIATAVNPVTENGRIYVPLRTTLEALDAHVSWNSHTKTATVLKDGKVLFPDGILVENRALVPVSFVTDTFGLKAEYLESLHVLSLTKDGKSYEEDEVLAMLPLYDGYTDEDLYWLSKIVEAEARDESFDSKLGVANVVLNRLGDASYPDTVKEVIFDSRCGVQFTPTANGSVYNTPTNESVLVAIDALEGRNNASTTLFFLNPRIAKSKWVQNNRQYAFSIGGHSYFY